MIAAIKIVTDRPLKKSDIDVAERKLSRKGHDPKKYILSFFEPDPKIDIEDWEVIPLVDFSNTLYDCAEAVGENHDMARSFDDCGSWLLLLDEFTTRYLEYYNSNFLQFETEKILLSSSMKPQNILPTMSRA